MPPGQPETIAATSRAHPEPNMHNPLLEMTGLPAFSRILPEHVEPAVDAALAACRAQIAALTRRGRCPPGRTSSSPWRRWTTA